MQRPVFAANWKMKHGPTDAKAFMRTFLAHYARRPDRSVLFFPSDLAFAAVAERRLSQAGLKPSRSVGR